MNTSGVVYVVDDDRAFRGSVTLLLTAAGLNVESFESGKDLLVRLTREPLQAAGCILADLRMPELDGLQLQEACAAAGIELPFVFLTGHGNLPSAVSAMRRGAVDFLEKCATEQALLSSLEQALLRAAEAHAARKRRALLERRFGALSEREREVLWHVVHGKMNKQIASTLGIHERTVKLHRNSITTKLGVRSVAELTTLSSEAAVFDASGYSYPQGN